MKARYVKLKLGEIGHYMLCSGVQIVVEIISGL
jgi:hypothetical protein